jgi:hypothetical protein
MNQLREHTSFDATPLRSSAILVREYQFYLLTHLVLPESG